MTNPMRLLLVAVLLTVTLSQTPEKAANIGYLAMGYNVYLGNPLANSVDPGFSISPVFNLTYTQSQTSPDGVYLEPDMVSIASEASCVLNSAATAITGANSYLHSLDVFASVDGGCPFGGFSSSVNYQTVQQSTSEQSTFYTLTTGQCSVYVADLALLDLPDLDSEFIQNAMSYLENSDSDSPYQFLDTYGTHYVQQITMGSRLSVMNSITESAWENMESQGISVTVAAQASFMGFYAGFSTSTSTQTTQVNTYQSSYESSQVTTIGSVPPNGGNSVTWAQQAVTDPMPIQYSLTSIGNVFNSTSFTTAVQGMGYTSESLQAVKANLQAALDGGYCSYLLAQGKVATCSAIGPDQPIPVDTGSCVLCASGCGGNYSQAQGMFDVTQEQQYWMMDYSVGCSQTTQLAENTYYFGVDLCCMQEVANEIQGSCRMCRSCGGQFYYKAGALWDNFVIAAPNIANGWLHGYADGCAGDLQSEGLSEMSDGYDFCCDGSDVCALCSTCGGEYPNETGVLGNGDTAQTAFSFLGDNCGGTLGYDQIAGYGGMKLCCASLN